MPSLHSIPSFLLTIWDTACCSDDISCLVKPVCAPVMHVCAHSEGPVLDLRARLQVHYLRPLPCTCFTCSEQRWAPYFPKAPEPTPQQVTDGNSHARARLYSLPLSASSHTLPIATLPWSDAQAQKNLRKEMIGFLILGPASAGLMIYDLIFGLENHEFHEIPP